MSSAHLTTTIIAGRSLLIKSVRGASLLWRVTGDPMKTKAIGSALYFITSSTNISLSTFHFFLLLSSLAYSLDGD